MDVTHTFLVSLSITIIGFFLTYLFTKKPKLRFYYGAITQIRFPTNLPAAPSTADAEIVTTPVAKAETTDPTPAINTALMQNFGVIRTHTIVISNQGNSTAHNVRIGHYFLPLGHSVSPPLNVKNPQNLNEILIPVLCPREIFTILYLYPTNNHFSEINSYLKCDEGIAEAANMRDVNIKSPFIISLIQCVFFIGIFAIIYFIMKIYPILYKLYFLGSS